VAAQKPEQQTLQLDEKCGTIALFHYGLIAPLVLERSLPARELNRRAREIAARVYDVPYSKRTWVPSIVCSIGCSATVRVASKPCSAAGIA
jgi:hypothetical protein